MSRSPGSPLRFALIGAGRVGTAVCENLLRAGHVISGVSSREAESAKRSAVRLNTNVFDHRSRLPATDAILLGVPDEAIASVVSAIAPFLVSGTRVVHFAGALGTGPLREARDAGCGAAALHPVQSFPDVDRGAERLFGSAWGVTTTSDLEAWAVELIERDLGGFAVIVAEDARPIWHAAAVSTSNGVAALLTLGEAMLAAIGIEEPHRVLGPLATGTVANAAERGGAGSLTGPVVRGDRESLALHLRALSDVSSHLAEDYSRIARVIVNSAVRAHRIEKEEAERMLELMKNPDQ